MKKQTPNIRFLQDCLLVDNKILVIGDLHLGSETVIPGFQVKEIIEKLGKIFSLLGKENIAVERVILLGDVKHDFASISDDEWRDSLKLFDYLDEKLNIDNLIQVKTGQARSNVDVNKIDRNKKDNKNNKISSENKTEKIIVLKGNHDTKLNPILRKRGIDLKDKYVYENICFLHGNKVFEQLFKQCLDSEVLVMGHLHPAITISDEYKKEKYKCFLKGKYKKKLTYILPSFNEGGIGFDLRKSEDKILKNFEVVVYDSKENKALNFGKLKKLV